MANFSSLSRELRDMIYVQYTLDAIDVAKKCPSTAPTFSALLATNRQVGAEVAKVHQPCLSNHVEILTVYYVAEPMLRSLIDALRAEAQPLRGKCSMTYGCAHSPMNTEQLERIRNEQKELSAHLDRLQGALKWGTTCLAAVNSLRKDVQREE